MASQSASAAPAAEKRKTDRRVIRTRKAIMDAFDRLVVRDGLDKVTVSALAREANIDRKTFYLHYRSINDLINHRSDESLQRIVNRLRAAGADKEPIERVRIVLAEVNAILLENLDLYQHIALSLPIDQVVGMLEQAMIPTLKSLGVSNLIISDESFRIRLQFYVAGGLSLYSTWITSDRSMPIESVSKTIEQAITTPSFPTLALI